MRHAGVRALMPALAVVLVGCGSANTPTQAEPPTPTPLRNYRITQPPPTAVPPTAASSVAAQIAPPAIAPKATAKPAASRAAPPPPPPPPVAPPPVAPPPPAASNCHPSYPDFCIPPPPPDLDCGDAAIGGRKNFTVRHDVPNPDPHKLDSDGDGKGCET